MSGTEVVAPPSKPSRSDARRQCLSPGMASYLACYPGPTPQSGSKTRRCSRISAPRTRRRSPSPSAAGSPSANHCGESQCFLDEFDPHPGRPRPSGPGSGHRRYGLAHVPSRHRRRADGDRTARHFVDAMRLRRGNSRTRPNSWRSRRYSRYGPLLGRGQRARRVFSSSANRRAGSNSIPEKWPASSSESTPCSRVVLARAALNPGAGPRVIDCATSWPHQRHASRTVRMRDRIVGAVLRTELIARHRHERAHWISTPAK